MKTFREDHLVRAASLADGKEVIGWYCEGNVLRDGAYERHRRAFIIPRHPDLRENSVGVIRLHSFIEVDPRTVEKQ